MTCLGCGARAYIGGRVRCPAYNQTCHHCNKTGYFSKAFWARQTQATASQFPEIWFHQPHQLSHYTDNTAGRHSTPSTTGPQTVTATQLMLTIYIGICTLSVNGSCDTIALPDSSADISNCRTTAFKATHSQPATFPLSIYKCQFFKFQVTFASFQHSASGYNIIHHYWGHC